MLPNTFPSYIFIRLSVWAVRAVIPACLACCVAQVLGYTAYLPRPVAALAWVEVLFYFCVARPRMWVLNRSRPSTVQRTRQERQELFEQSWAHIPDLEKFLSVWFCGAAPEDVGRDDFKDLLAWAFFYEAKPSPAHEDEIETYVQRTEEALGRAFPAGHGTHRAMQVSIDPLRFNHKPFFIYTLGIGMDDCVAYIKMRSRGLEHYRLPLAEYATEFPPRLHTLFTSHVSGSRRLSYWHRPHTSRTRLPLLFLHGIGVGVRTYTGFLRDFVRADDAAVAAGQDGQTGIIFVELMAISMRMTRAILPRQEMLAEILSILDRHGWNRFVVMGHSYGTILATHLLHHLRDTDRVGPMVLADPVTLSMHWGDIPYNFLYRAPRRASEWQLHFFASTDMGIAHSITRRFDWTVNVLWREDMRGRAWTVALASEDIIVDTHALQKYLADDDELRPHVYNAQDLRRRADGTSLWKPRAEKGLDLFWYDGLNHSDMFEHAEAWQPLLAVLQNYCAMK